MEKEKELFSIAARIKELFERATEVKTNERTPTPQEGWEIIENASGEKQLISKKAMTEQETAQMLGALSPYPLGRLSHIKLESETKVSSTKIAGLACGSWLLHHLSIPATQEGQRNAWNALKTQSKVRPVLRVAYAALGSQGETLTNALLALKVIKKEEELWEYLQNAQIIDMAEYNIEITNEMRRIAKESSKNGKSLLWELEREINKAKEKATKTPTEQANPEEENKNIVISRLGINPHLLIEVYHDFRKELKPENLEVNFLKLPLNFEFDHQLRGLELEIDIANNTSEVTATIGRNREEHILKIKPDDDLEALLSPLQCVREIPIKIQAALAATWLYKADQEESA